MKHRVRGTLLSLFAGVTAQRLLQLLAFVLIGRTLGASGLGLYAQGQALAAVLTVLAGAGVRSVVARALLRDPDAGRSLVVAAVRLRFVLGALLAGAVAATAHAASATPWFWSLCALQALPAALDLKLVADAAGRTRSEVLLESSAAALQLALVGAWAANGGQELTTLAAIALGCRLAYACGAAALLRGFVRTTERPGVATPRPSTHSLSTHLSLLGVGQTAHELLTIGDIALVGVCFGDAAAGLYAVGSRFATAALLPSAQLARLLLPHLLAAPANGDAQRAFRTAVRVTVWGTLPALGGGLVTAEPLCALCGDDFRPAANALRLLLLAGCLQHVAWQASHALLALGRDRAYAHAFLWPALAHPLLLVTPLFVAGTPDGNAARAALVLALSHAGYLTIAARALAGRGLSAAMPWPALVAAAATALAALAPGVWLDGPLRLPLQLLAGGAAFAAVLWLAELRGRLRRLGDGLAAASGFSG